MERKGELIAADPQALLLITEPDPLDIVKQLPANAKPPTEVEK